MIKGAFEDSYLRKELINLIKKYKIDTIIETGTYKGWSTNILAQEVKQVITIEINKDFLEEAKINNINNKNILFYNGSSDKILEEILPNLKKKKILFFLDAHWHEYWPILDELTIIEKSGIKPVIIIHDFFVPDESGNAKFGFDRYKEQNLDYNYVKNHIEQIYKQDYNHYCLQDCEIDAGVGIFCPLD